MVITSVKIFLVRWEFQQHRFSSLSSPGRTGPASGPSSNAASIGTQLQLLKAIDRNEALADAVEKVFAVESDAQLLARVEEFARLVASSFRPGLKVSVRIRLEPGRRRVTPSGLSVGVHVPTLQHKQARTAAKANSPKYRARKARNQRNYLKRKKAREAAARAAHPPQGPAPSDASRK